MNVDKKLLENRVFDCQTGDKWQLKTLFLVIFGPNLSIVKSVFDCCLSVVIFLSTSLTLLLSWAIQKFVQMVLAAINFSCSTQLSMKFEMLLKTKMLKNIDFSCFKTLRCSIYPAYKY